jgi:sugar/nucleoside kinase (ribokinase family)
MELICVTLGKDGCHYYHDGKLHRHSGYKANAVDSTGAGDAFVAGLLFGLEQGWGVERSVDFANATGAVSTFRRFPDLSAVEGFIKKG